MRLIAELSMPNNNSWNGRWSGENEKYTVNFSRSPKMEKFIGDYYYDFGDGWTARVAIRPAVPRERVTGKFMGYNWMLRSIKDHGEIKTT